MRVMAFSDTGKYSPRNNFSFPVSLAVGVLSSSSVCVSLFGSRRDFLTQLVAAKTAIEMRPRNVSFFFYEYYVILRSVLYLCVGFFVILMGVIFFVIVIYFQNEKRFRRVAMASLNKDDDIFGYFYNRPLIIDCETRKIQLLLAVA